MFSRVRPHQWVAIRLPSDGVKVEQMIPNVTISLGKFGSFRTNQVIDRPFYITWEIVEKSDDRQHRELRVVRASELHADAVLEEAESDIVGDAAPNTEFDEYGLPGVEKSNVNIYDDQSNQKLTMDEIEALKADGMSNPRELIAKIMSSHTTLDQKTAFSLAKYTIRKQKKYMKRFTILPLDVSMMTDWIMYERDFSKVMGIRNEVLGMLCSWANVHSTSMSHVEDNPTSAPAGRYLVVDDTGGLVVAALAERMGILHHTAEQPPPPPPPPPSPPSKQTDGEDAAVDAHEAENDQVPSNTHKRRRVQDRPLPTSNTIHLIHSNQQPNLSWLRYFNYDPNVTPSSPDSTTPHLLHSHLKTLTWLQLVEPTSDTTYQEPPLKTTEELHAMKANARSTFYRKRRRWERCKAVVDETRAGGFNGLVIATYTNPLSILHQLVPLLTGGAQIVVYHPHVEPLAEVFDAYSTARRTAFIKLGEHEKVSQTGTAKFPVDPTLTLGFTLHTARVKEWQVLPGRTHPLMMGRGGAEGYIATATRVLPSKGKIQARGKQVRRGKKVPVDGEVVGLDNGQVEVNDSSGDEDIPDSKKLKVGSDSNEVDMLAGVGA